MTIKDFYNAIGGDYQDVLNRLPTEKMILKYVKRFEDDQSFSTLTEALNSQDVQTAFRASHTLKGLCLTLGMTALGNASSELTESLRNFESVNVDYADILYENVKEEYEKVIAAIRSIE